MLFQTLQLTLISVFIVSIGYPEKRRGIFGEWYLEWHDHIGLWTHKPHQLEDPVSAAFLCL